MLPGILVLGTTRVLGSFGNTRYQRLYFSPSLIQFLLCPLIAVIEAYSRGQ